MSYPDWQKAIRQAQAARDSQRRAEENGQGIHVKNPVDADSAWWSIKAQVADALDAIDNR